MKPKTITATARDWLEVMAPFWLSEYAPRDMTLMRRNAMKAVSVTETVIPTGRTAVIVTQTVSSCGR